MKSCWFRCVAMAAVALLATETVHARSALRGLAAAHGSAHYDGDEPVAPVDSDALVDDDKWEWKALDEVEGTTTRDVKTSDDGSADDDAESSSSSSDDTDDAALEDGSAEGSTSYDFDAIANEASSDPRGVSGGFNSAAQTAVTPAPSVAAVPIGESAAAAKPISEISPSAIQKDPEAYGVVTPAPSTLKPVPIGESAAAAKPISDIDPSAIQRDPKSYGVTTSPPGTTTGKLSDGPMAATKPTEAPADQNPMQKAF